MSDRPRSRTPSDEDLLDELRRLHAVRGKLTSSLIEASQITRPPQAYIRRFGSLIAAYGRIGYEVSERQRVTLSRSHQGRGAGIPDRRVHARKSGLHRSTPRRAVLPVSGL